MSLPLQNAIFQQLQLLQIPVYDVALNNADLPYISIGESQLEMADTVTKRRQQGIVDITLWSASSGFAEVKTLEAQVKDTLDTQQLNAINSNIIHFEWQQSRHKLREAEGLLQVMMRFRVIIEGVA